VPRFWICAAPIVRAAATSAGTCSRLGRPDDSWRFGGTDFERIVHASHAFELRQRPQIQNGAGRGSNGSGVEHHHEIGAAREETASWVARYSCTASLMFLGRR
jgi:hypothetical protein